LTLLDSINLEVFLGIFVSIFNFFEFKFKAFESDRYVPVQTGTGDHRYHRYSRYTGRFAPVRRTLAVAAPPPPPARTLDPALPSLTPPLSLSLRPYRRPSLSLSLRRRSLRSSGPVISPPLHPALSLDTVSPSSILSRRLHRRHLAAARNNLLQPPVTGANAIPRPAGPSFQRAPPPKSPDSSLPYQEFANRNGPTLTSLQQFSIRTFTSYFSLFLNIWRQYN
jgi:hypothetical protein